ncbi:MAG: collagen-binding protein [Bacteroidetes bacterium GWA2_30_7]|nr:MAG: collagen-binding protein [Bacteroidetes bacterium GWA2_30_7]
MKKILKLYFIFLIILSINTYAQEKSTLSGYLKDESSGEELIGASVYIPEIKSGGTTNIYGFYSVTVPKGEYTVQFSFIGYNTKAMKIKLTENKRLDVEISLNSELIDEVEIKADAEDKNIRSTEMGVVKLDIKEIQSIPVIFGEQDILKTIQLMPGIKAAGEGNSGFYVRGGNIDQNLILLDEAPVYSASHLLGFFSVFNSDAIKDVKMIKGGMPAEYGGRLSSVLDIVMKDGNSKEYEASGGIGLIASRLTVEGPIVKDKGSFIASGRRTYVDMFLKVSNNERMKKSKLYFYDLNLKANYRFGANDRLFLSGYFGRDVFGFADLLNTNWGNATTTLRWNHLFSEKLFLNSSLIYSDYTFNVGMKLGKEDFSILSGIKDMNLKEDFEYFINTNNSIKFGGNAIYHTFRPGEISSSIKAFNDFSLENKHAVESAIYLSHDFSFKQNFKLNYGIRYSDFLQIGPGDIYSFDNEGNTSDTTTYSKFEIVKNYGGFEPRISLTYLLNSSNSIKVSYNRNRQYVHLLSNTTSGTPLDAWVPSSTIIKPEISDQYALGYFKNLFENKFESSVEVYYKDLKNQVDYKNGANLMLNPYVESQLVFGIGRAYGLELFIKKRSGKLTGWISYTLSKTEKQFDEIDNGKWFPARYDRIHDVSIVAMYKISEKLNISATWVYYTGDAVTFPSGKYTIEGETVSYYTERNGYRMPDYHRMDLGVTYYNKKTAKTESSWNFSVYNAYLRENAYAITFRQNADDPSKTEAVRISLFKIIPSITYNFKF